ncbi:MAG: hypothetical protein BroJett022_15770 [Actinomycetes bacterium]|nr:MAG: hypothetical protein BroJett022_15770 [Actinomycetes bacterium]
MDIKRRYVATAAAVVALGAGTGVALATAGGEDDAGEQVSGPDAAKAKAAALEVTGGGTANSVERDDDGAAWEVEVTRPDGETVDVSLDGALDRVAVESDSEEAGDSD